jgi:integrase
MSLRFTKLDRAALRKLGAGEVITEHGVVAKKLANGDIRWAVNVMVDGKRIHRWLGRESDRVTRTQCEEFIEQAKSDARAGRLALPKGRKLALTVAAAAGDYISRLEESGGRNVTIKRRHFHLYLKPFFGTMRLDAVSTFTVDRYRKRRGGEGASPATINREIATLSHFYTKALEWKWIDRRPCKLAKAKEPGGRIIALTGEQCDALMRASIKSADPYCWLFVAFGLNTAMRHAEILSTRWDKLDVDHLRLFIPDAKAGQREQPITPELAALLRQEREMRDQNGWIFPSPHKDSGTGHIARMDRAFREAVIEAGLDPALVTPHVMRHSAITALVKAGVDLPTIQKISGHKTLTMVLRYVHVHGQHIDAAIRAIGRPLPELAANESGNTVTPKLHQATRARFSRKAERLGHSIG